MENGSIPEYTPSSKINLSGIRQAFYGDRSAKLTRSVVCGAPGGLDFGRRVASFSMVIIIRFEYEYTREI